MTDFDCVIRGGTVVGENGIGIVDVGVRDGRIVALASGLTDAARIIDASGLLVLPGGIDTHTHIEQGIPGKAVFVDDFQSATASAAVGGTTTVVCFARQGKGESLKTVVETYHRAAARSRIDYAFHLMITDPTNEVLERELPALVAAGNRSLKVFMANPGAMLTDSEVLRVLAQARRLGAIVCIHAENHGLIEFYRSSLLQAGLTAPKFHAWSRPMVVESECVHRAIALAEALDVPIQIFHLSGAASLAEVEQARARGLQVWAETCPHYLVLTAAALDRPGYEAAAYVCSPALRTVADQEALWDGLRRGVINNVSSDHSPARAQHPREGLTADNLMFTDIPNGLPGLAARMPVMFSEGVGKGRIDLGTFVMVTATNPAKLFGLWPRKGAIAVGADADIALWDTERRVTLTNALMQHGADATPYEGLEVVGWPTMTLLRGVPICTGGVVSADPGTGMFLAREPYPMIEPRNLFPTPFNPVDRTTSKMAREA